MNLTLVRRQFRSDGVFGVLTGTEGGILGVTLEHAYEQPSGSYAAKIQAGTYNCVKGQHWLKKSGPLVTFQVMDVPGHDKILFHIGNFNEDSEGCILIGTWIKCLDGAKWNLQESKKAFEKFLNCQSDVGSFILTVIGE